MRLFALLFILASFPVISQANSNKGYSHVSQFKQVVHDTYPPLNLWVESHLKIEYAIKSYTLFKEPVVNCAAKWDLEFVKVGINEQEYSIPVTDIKSEVEIVNLVGFAKMMRGVEEIGYLRCDAGDLSKAGSGKASFNVPESPNWDRFIFSDNIEQKSAFEKIQRSLAFSKNQNDRPAQYFEPVDYLTKERAVQAYQRTNKFFVYPYAQVDLNISAIVNWGREKARESRQESVAAKEKQLKPKITRYEESKDSYDLETFAEALIEKSSIESEIEIVGREQKQQDYKVKQEPYYPPKKKVNKQLFTKENISHFENLTSGLDIIEGWQSKLETEGLKKFCHHYKCGYETTSGEVIIASQYGRESEEFHENYAKVSIGYNEFTFVDRTNKRINNHIFKSASSFKEGYAAVKDSNGWTFINKNGDFITDKRFDYVSDFSEGFAVAKENSLYGMIKPDGTWLIKPKYARLSIFKEGKAAFRHDGSTLWGYIDFTDYPIIKPQFNYADDFSYGLAAVDTADNKLGYINSSGDMTILPLKKYQATNGDYFDGYAAVISILDNKNSYNNKILVSYNNIILTNEPAFSITKTSKYKYEIGIAESVGCKGKDNYIYGTKYELDTKSGKKTVLESKSLLSINSRGCVSLTFEATYN